MIDGDRYAKLVCTLTVVFATLLLAAPAARAADEEDHLPHHHIALFLGGGVETKRGNQEEGFAVGLDYAVKFRKHWGVGIVAEGLGQDTVRDYILLPHASYYFGSAWRVFAGGGVEFTKKKDKGVLRLGLGYEFPLAGHWTLAPELYTDFIEGGAVTYVGGVSLGYGF